MVFSAVFPLTNDSFLGFVLFLLSICVVHEAQQTHILDVALNMLGIAVEEKEKEKEPLPVASPRHDKGNYKSSRLKIRLLGKDRPKMCLNFPPVRSGCKSRNFCILDLASVTSYIPANIPAFKSMQNNSKVESNSSVLDLTTFRSSGIQASEASMEQVNSVTVTSSAGSSTSTAASPSSSSSSSFSVQALKLKGKMNLLPGCEPDGSVAEKLALDFPNLTRIDICRFLVARKGDYELAKEMIMKEREWHNGIFPVKAEDVEPAFKTSCFFPYGYARNGTPVVYMRGGLYDSNTATPQQYVLAAAHIIEFALRESAKRPIEEGGDGTPQVNVTVVVHAAAVPGVPNATGADMNFIKLFTKVLGDNYPERLRNLVIWPFPWYGRAIWGVAKMFVDKRTQDKVALLSNSLGSNGLPPELLALIDEGQIPSFMGGKNEAPVMDLMSTLEGGGGGRS